MGEPLHRLGRSRVERTPFLPLALHRAGGLSSHRLGRSRVELTPVLPLALLLAGGLSSLRLGLSRVERTPFLPLALLLAESVVGAFLSALHSLLAGGILLRHGLQQRFCGNLTMEAPPSFEEASHSRPLHGPVAPVLSLANGTVRLITN